MKGKNKLRILEILCIISILITVFSIQRTYAKYFEMVGTTYQTNIKKQTNQEVVLEEIHHKTKKDIPSGSAKMLIATLKRNNVVPKVVALRVGKVIGTHKVKIYGDFETLTLTHNVENRQVFCLGAYKACKFILSKKCGLYNMENLIDCM